MNDQLENTSDGGLVDGMSVNPQIETEVDDVKKVEAKPIYVGTKQFSSQEDLVKYTDQLQQRVIEKELKNQVPAYETANQPKISNLMFEDPEAYTEAVVQEAERRFKDEVVKKDTTKKVWGKFYEENPDLKNFKEMVEAQYAYRKDEYKDLPVEEGLSKIKHEVRSSISKIKGSVQGGKELPSGSAKVAGTSNDIATTQVAVSKAKTFAEQIRQRQKRGRG